MKVVKKRKDGVVQRYSKKTSQSNVEYAIWGTRDGVEQVIRVNGEETQPTLERAETIKRILSQRGEFHSIRIQKIDMSSDYDPSRDFAGAVR